MNASYHQVRPMEADLCRDCRFATFQALPVGQSAVVATFCKRMDCDNVETRPIEPRPVSVPHGIALGGARSGVLRRAWQSIVDNVRSVW